MSQSTKIIFWKGRLLENLTREELIEAVEYLGDKLAYFQTPENIEALAEGKAALLVKSVKEDVDRLKRSQIWPDDGRTPTSPVYTRNCE